MTLAWRCPECGGALTKGTSLNCSSCDASYSRANGVWVFDNGFEPHGFSRASQEHLTQLEESGHFWFPARRKLLASALGKLLGEKKVSMAVEIGCGSGSFLPTLAENASGVVAVDAYAESLAFAAMRCPGAVLVQCDGNSLPLEDGQFDLAVILDVLEHGDPRTLLAETARVMRPGGLLLLSVPASQALWSDLDVAAGHRSRYSVPLVSQELRDSGWTLLGHTHYQCLLFPLVYASRRMTSGNTRSIERRPPELLNRLLGLVNRMEVALFSGVRLPFGSSLVVWAEKTG